jgi:hypothetical protein
VARREKFRLPNKPIPPDLVDEMMVQTQIRERAQVEAKAIKANIKLAAALRKQPAVWVEGICIQHGLDAPEKNAERIKGLAEALPRREVLTAAWRRLNDRARAMLEWIVVDKGGVAQIDDLAERYEPDDDVSWWWNQGQTPRTPLGLLRVNGLVVVGTVRIDGGAAPAAVVPLELREPLAQVCRTAAYAADETQELNVATPRDPGAAAPADAPAAPDEAEPKVEWVSLDEFVRRTPFVSDTEEMYADLLEKVADNPKAFRQGPVRQLLERVLREGHPWARLAAYAAGVSVFGPRFADEALRDPSAQVRAFARGIVLARSGR